MARFVWKEQGVRKVGNNDTAVSPYLKCCIKQGNTCVIGVIADGTSKEITANWESPFEGDSVGSQVQKIGGLIQSGAVAETAGGMTSITSLNSRQVWNGNMPHTFNLAIQLYALSDAKAEVEDAIMELERMISPDLNAANPVGDSSREQAFGRTPQSVILNIGRNVMIKDCLITSVSIPLDGPRTKDGYLTSALVNVGIQSRETLSRRQIAATYG